MTGSDAARWLKLLDVERENCSPPTPPAPPSRTAASLTFGSVRALRRYFSAAGCST